MTNILLLLILATLLYQSYQQRPVKLKAAVPVVAINTILWEMARLHAQLGNVLGLGGVSYV